MSGMSLGSLQVLHQLLLLLEDVLEFSQSRLHLLQGELVLSLSRLVLGNPGVELSDSVVKQNPFLDQDLTLLDPGLRHSLDLVKPGLESSHLSVSLSVCGHLERSSLSSLQHLEVVLTGLVKGVDLVIECLDLVKIRWLRQTLSGGLLSTGQPGRELLDASSVLSPELDIIGVFVTLNLGLNLL